MSLGGKPSWFLCVFDMEKFVWTKLNLTGEVPKYARYGHTMDAYKKFLVVFGGEERQDKDVNKVKQIYNDTRLINTDTMEVKYARASGDIIQPRKNHASCIVGR